MDTLDLVICKAVATEVFPGRGWIGIVGPDNQGKRALLALHTRPELYRRVGMIMRNNGEAVVRESTKRFKVPMQYQLMFASVKDAYDGNHARRLIESHLGG